MAKPRAGSLFETGVSNLDFILGGGLPEADTLLVLGPAGSGKTTLSLQMAFHSARLGHKVLYVSTYSESPTQLLRHSRTFSFYDESFIGKRIFLLSVYPLVKEDLGSLIDALVEAAREAEAKLVIVDGLMTIHDLHPNPYETRTLLYDLGATLSALGCTTILTRSLTTSPPVDASPELTTSDAVVELGIKSIGTQVVRTVQIRKLRGRAPRLGTHSLRIDGDGLKVFPRLESAEMRPIREPSGERVPFGLPEIDRMMSGGPPAGSLTLIAGTGGMGKTVASLQFLIEGARRGERGLYVGLRETPAELVARARRLGLDLDTPVRRKQIVLLHHSPVDLVPDELGSRMFEAMARLSPARMVIDGIFELERALERERERGFLASLARRQRGFGVTSLILKEIAQIVGPELDFSDTPMAVLAENLLLFRYVELRGELVRVLSVLKMSDSDCDRSIRQYTITSAGLRVLSAVQSAEGLLTGIGRIRPARPIPPRETPARRKKGRT